GVGPGLGLYGEVVLRRGHLSGRLVDASLPAGLIRRQALLGGRDLGGSLVDAGLPAELVQVLAADVGRQLCLIAGDGGLIGKAGPRRRSTGAPIRGELGLSALSCWLSFCTAVA